MAVPETTAAPVARTAPLAAPRVSPFAALQHEIDRVFRDFDGWPGLMRVDAMRPSMDVSETDENIEVQTELPGMDEKDVEITVVGDLLTIRGEKRAEKEDKRKAYRVVERRYGAFERAITVPPGIDPAGVKATMHNGVLHVTLPKPATSKTQRIPIGKA